MKTKPHILHLPEWYPNKTDVQLGVFIRQQIELMNDDFENTVIYVQPIAGQKEEFNIEDEIEKNVRTIRVYVRQSTSPLKKIFNLFRYKKAQSLALKKVSSKIDLVHLHVPFRCTLLTLLKLKNIPSIVSEHWSGHLSGEFDKLGLIYRFLHSKAIKSAKLITVVSKPLQLALGKSHLIQAKIFPNVVAGSPSPIPSLKSGVKALFVGDFNDKTKNISGLLDAVAKVIGQEPSFQLDLIGDGPDKYMIEEKISRLNLEKNVHLLGRKSQKEVHDSFAKYHFLVSNSHTETFGMAIAEAIVHGRPVIATTSGGPESFVNDENGLLIPSGNTNELQNALLLLAGRCSEYNPSLMSKSILEKFGSQSSINKWKKAYLESIND